jgi:hypothetical protein
LVENTATTTHFLTSPSLLFAANTRYVVSIYVKAAERSWVALQYDSGPFGTSPTAYFNVGAGVLGSAFNGAIATMVGVGDGWYRCSIAATTTTSTTGNARLYLATGDNAASYTGVAGSGAFAWGGQLEPVTYQTTPGTYNATTASAYYGPRFDYDPVTLAPRGLLIEEARTNLLLQSDNLTTTWSTTRATVSANVTASPDGTVNADKLVDDATATQTHSVAQSLTIVAATNYTLSLYVKAAEYTSARILLGDTGGNNGVRVDVNLITGATTTGTNGTGWTLLSAAMTAVGNGWWRVTLSGTNATATAGTVVIYNTSSFGTIIYTGVVGNGVYIWGAQLEAGAFATSYIPTVASTVSRSADIATMTGTNFSSWYNQTEGTFITDVDTAGISSAGGGRIITAADSATETNAVASTVSQALLAGIFVASGGATQVNTTSATAVSINTPFKLASAYKLNDCAASFNGATPQTDVVATIPSNIDRMNIGNRGVADRPINGHIRAIAYYNTRLPNTQLQTLTAPSLASPLALDFLSTSYTVGY